MYTFAAVAAVIFVCGFLIARVVNVFWNASSIARDIVVTFFQGLALAGVIMIWKLL
ncbi:hypothetical protein [Salibacterium halotolerans]|uniref:Uncharacterized protein n=1 Tax=Salibacterium halotolerans TaxID=1884432 RepID=A0A1I5TSJ7_9BACI|nr:hypothetical protein [Salibacterium halotolerans]SFP86034.1 hypothetical protein SAMN05518683_11175 [Salibacterium halotolerans]